MAEPKQQEYFQGITKFEKARIIGARALQISMGAPFKVKLSDEDLAKIGYNPVEIAKLEFDKDLIPIEIERVYPKKREQVLTQ